MGDFTEVQASTGALNTAITEMDNGPPSGTDPEFWVIEPPVLAKAIHAYLVGPFHMIAGAGFRLPGWPILG